MNSSKNPPWLLLIAFGTLYQAVPAVAQTPDIERQEKEAATFTSPSVLTREDGTPVSHPHQWPARRLELLHLFQQHVYGKMPSRPLPMRFATREDFTPALKNTALRKQVSIFFSEKEKPRLDLLIYLPINARKRTPVFMGLNFYGNHTVTAETQIVVSDVWTRNNESLGITNNRATAASRGKKSQDWPVELLIKRGYGLVTAYYGDIEPDYDGGIKEGVRPLYYKEGQTRPADNEWGAIGAWAWGLSRALDYLETETMIDGKRSAGCLVDS